MKKRIFSLFTAITVVTTMLTVFTINAGAVGTCYSEDFSDNEFESFDVLDSKTTVDYYAVENGGLKFGAASSGKKILANIHNFDGTRDVVIEFDLKATVLSGQWLSTSTYFTVGNKCAVITSGNKLPAGDWYHIKVRCISDGTNIESATWEYTKHGTSNTVQNSPMTIQDQARSRNFEMTVYAQDWTVEMDNICVYDESALLGGNFKMDSTEITTASAVTAGTLTAEAEIGSVIAKSGLRKLMVAFDNTGKMLSCSSTDQSQDLAATTTQKVTQSITLDAEQAAAVSSGGYVGFYIWDNMHAEVKALELN